MIQLATVTVKLKHFVERKKHSRYDNSLLIDLEEATVLLELAESHARLLTIGREVANTDEDQDLWVWKDAMQSFREAIEQAERL